MKKAGQPRTDRTPLTVVVNRTVNLFDMDQLAHRTGAEHFIGAADFLGSDIADVERNPVRLAQLQHRAAVIPSGHARVVEVSTLPRVTMKTCVAFVSARKPSGSSMKRIIRARGVGFELGKNRRHLVARMDVLIQHIGQRPPDGRGDKGNAIRIVHGRLKLRQDNQSASGGVDVRVETGRVLYAAQMVRRIWTPSVI